MQGCLCSVGAPGQSLWNCPGSSGRVQGLSRSGWLQKGDWCHMLFLQLALRLCLCVSPKARSLCLAGASVLHITQQAHSSSIMSLWTALSAQKIPLNNLRLLFLHNQKGIEQEYKRKWGGVGHYFWNVFMWMVLKGLWSVNEYAK